MVAVTRSVGGRGHTAGLDPTGHGPHHGVVAVRETRVEKALRVEVRDRGGWAIKLLPSVSGLPDRIVLLPGGRITFVELKSPTGTVAPHQSVIHRRLAELGFPVVVLSSVEAVEEWINE